MRLAYLDCFSGISGDMFVAAFLDAGVELEELRSFLECLPVGGWKVSATKTKRGHFAATMFRVSVEEAKKERRLSEILELIDRSSLPPRVKENSSKVFLKLAEAESTVHGVQPEEVHFHEVGAIDSIVDIVGAASCLHLAGIDRMYVSTLSLGKGGTNAQHGLIPLPAPATSVLLLGHSVRMIDIEAELVTPTGAAIVSSLGEQGDVPVPFRLECIGCGAGSNEFESLPNVLRVFVGSCEGLSFERGFVQVLETTIDDMNPQLYEFLRERLLELGALDVFLTAVHMKKGRPGVLVTVLCEPGLSTKLGEEILRQTTTLGLRLSTQTRMELARDVEEVSTAYGTIRMKVPAAYPDRASPEYDDCYRAARTHGVPLIAVHEAAKTAWSRRSPA
ncbi:MAG: nickel pincer cofactor biosynthesis protein LarC [Candidatus Eisenbacteria bacterium]|nr:nickel pincer cofactor biosynthesis protein LarC [Candidatus Eisenbacteria bacterium]